MGRATATSREEVNTDDLVFTRSYGWLARPARGPQTTAVIAYERIWEEDGHRQPVSLPMSEVTGRLSPIIAGQLPMSIHPRPQTFSEARGTPSACNQQAVDMVTVAQVMTPDPITAAPDDSLRLARDRMVEGGIRRLPVVQSGKLVGIVTHRDLRRAANSPFVLRERWYDDLILDQVKVWGAMTANPITVDADAPLVVAARLMRDHKIGGLPVIMQGAHHTQGVYDRQQEPRDSQLVGIITETDLLDYLIDLLSGRVEQS